MNDEGTANASAFHELSAQSALFVETAAGYRQLCIKSGFPPESADEMAVDYHRMLLAQMTKALSG